ncbi:hypothetical protein HDU76_006537 [Blyttiomyces sp. JEL0837]|nr:hypothetical protein HDU76_006537 [Blyttiomyces sp. JEL0837]
MADDLAPLLGGGGGSGSLDGFGDDFLFGGMDATSLLGGVGSGSGSSAGAGGARNVDPAGATAAANAAQFSDPNVIDELCDIFKTKAQCTEMQKLQDKILEACQNGDKDRVMDLVDICKEKKRMYLLRLKAGVTVLPNLIFPHGSHEGSNKGFQKVTCAM